MVMPTISNIVSTIILFIGVFASTWGVIQLISWIGNKIALIKINNKNLPSLSNKAKRFLENGFDIEWDFKLVAKKGSDDKIADYGSTLIFTISNPRELNESTLPPYIIEAITSKVKQAIVTECYELKYDEVLYQDISDQAAIEFLNKEVFGSLTKNKITIDGIQKIFEKNQTGRRIDSKDYSVLKKLVKNRSTPEEIKRNYLHQKKDLEPSRVIEQIIEKKLPPQDDSKIEASHPSNLPKDSLKKLNDMREAWLKGDEELIKYIKRADKIGADEKIYYYILYYNSYHSSRLARISRLPLGTAVSYVYLMEQKGLVVRQGVTKDGVFRKEIFPYITEEQIIKHMDKIQPILIGVKGILSRKDEKFYIKEYSKLDLDLNKADFNRLNRDQNLIGKSINVVASVESDDKKITLHAKDISFAD